MKTTIKTTWHVMKNGEEIARGRVVFDDCTLEEANHFAASLPQHVAAKVVKK